MPYRYLDDVAIADAALEAWGDTIEEMLTSASDALINIMIEDLGSIRLQAYRHFRIENETLDMLLFDLLQELIYHKDAEQLLLRVRKINIAQRENAWHAEVEAAGEPIDPARHDLIVDVKAITLHRFQVQQTSQGWTATVIVDV
jgi:SHS2 domain-containing protein